MKLLIVDDDELILSMLNDLMSAQGYEVVRARNGAEALTIARRETVDLIITDILMPVMDGFALCRECKRDERLKNIPLVFYTANYTDPKDRDFALRLGAERFVAKPASFDDVVRIIREVIEERHSSAQTEYLLPVDDEMTFLREHNEALVRKLEDELLRLERLNRALQEDIIERKRVEEALREGEEKFRVLAEVSPVGMCIIGGEQAVYVNPTAETMTGYTTQEMLTMNFWDLLHPSFRDPVLKRALARQRGERVPSRYDVKYLTKAGEERWGDVSASVIRFQGETAILATVLDITDRKRAEEALRKSQASLEQAQARANLGSWELDIRSQTGFWSKEMYRIFERDAALGPPSFSEFLDMIHPQDRRLIIEAQDLAMWSDKQVSVDFRTNPKRTMRHLNGTLESVRDASGNPVMIVGTTIDITERKMAEEALKSSESRYRMLFERNLAGVYRSSVDGRVQECNQAFARIFGYDSVQEVIGLAAQDFYFDPSDREPLAARLREQGALTDLELCLKRKDGSPVWVLESVSLLTDESGAPAGAQGTIIDITERKRAEELLQTRALQQAAVAELGQRALSGVNLSALMDETVTLAARCLDVEYCKVLELLPDSRSLILRSGVGWKEGLVGQATVGAGKDSQAGFTLLSNEPVIVENLATDSRFSGPPLLICHGVVSGLSVIIPGQTKPFGVIGAHTTRRRKFTLDEANFLQALANVLAEAIERKQAEEEIHKGRLWLEAIFEASRDGIIVEENETIVYANRSYAALNGYDRIDEVIGKPLSLFNSPQDNDRMLDYGRRRLRGEAAPSLYEFKGVKKDGSLIDLEAAVSVFDIGTKSYIVTTVRDITERKRAEGRLRAAEEKYRSIIHNAVYGIYLSSPEGRFLEVNPALVSMLGYDSAGELMALDISRDIFLDSRERERLMKYWNEGSFEGIEARWKRKDQSTIIVRLSGRAIRNDEERLEAFEVIVEDITERRSLEEQLRQSQKMEAIGRLAGGVAHDFNNLLTAINGYADIIIGKLPGDNPLHQDAEEIRKAGKRAATLTGQLLAFSRRQMLQTRVLNLNSVINDSIKMLRRMIGEDVELITRLDDDLALVRADPGQIEQVIMNLAVNARDAMPQGGTLTIETANTLIDESYTRKHVSTRLGRYVRLKVNDTGCGMDEEICLRIFEPFFTTKERGKGTGLGLSTVYGIVKQSGGHITVNSQPNKGTTFRILLPMVEEKTDEAGAPAAHRAHPPKGSETILVVEDEEAVRKLTRIILSVGGYTVLEAANGREAIEMCSQRSVDLLLTDVVMPQMSGRELVEKVSIICPQMKVLYMSGYTDDAMIRHGVLDAGVPLLQKPFTPEALSQKVREVLDN
ncbi:MAG: PAS domain S-box protein [Acidobacteriota bacterium]